MADQQVSSEAIATRAESLLRMGNAPLCHADPCGDILTDQVYPALHQGGLLALLGPRGSGGTAIAVAAMREVCIRAATRQAADGAESRAAAGPPARYIPMSALPQSGPGMADLMRKLLEPTLLVIGGVTVRTRGATGLFLNQLLSQRHRAGKDTILLSSLSASKLQNWVGTWLVWEVGTVIPCERPSFRGKTAGAA